MWGPLEMDASSMIHGTEMTDTGLCTMPVMDGRKLHRAVRENPSYQNSPFLFVSEYGDEYVKNAVKDPRYEGFYGKGESIDKLMSLIHSLTNPMKKAQKDGGED
jgi:CheY-like chemotaxis protein